MAHRAISTVNYLTKALIPTVMTTIEMSPLVGGQAQTIHFYDGDDKDVFVLSVGLHHFMCVVYDGQAGSRQFGSITRYGRRAAQDLIALAGRVSLPHPTGRNAQTGSLCHRIPQTSKRKAATNEVEKVELELAVKPDMPVEEPEHVKLDPIQNFDLGLFDQLMDSALLTICLTLTGWPKWSTPVQDVKKFPLTKPLN